MLWVSRRIGTGWSEALEAFDGRVAASHHNCRALVPGQRQLSDEMIKAIVERGGVIGGALDAWMLDPQWQREVPACDQLPHVTLETVADQLDHIAQLAGSTRHCGIGSDLDGAYGQEQAPQGVDTIADLQQLAGILGEARLFLIGRSEYFLRELDPSAEGSMEEKDLGVQWIEGGSSWAPRASLWALPLRSCLREGIWRRAPRANASPRSGGAEILFLFWPMPWPAASQPVPEDSVATLGMYRSLLVSSVGLAQCSCRPRPAPCKATRSAELHRSLFSDVTWTQWPR